MIKAEDNIALKSTKGINDTATSALSKANSAKDIADNTNQYFWHTSTGSDTGAHITEKTQEAFLADPANGGGNLLARSNGIAVRDGLTELASFGADATQIGASGATHGVFSSDFINFVTEDDDPILVAGKLPRGAYGLYLGTDSPLHGGVTLDTHPDADAGFCQCSLTARSEPNTQTETNDAALALEAYLLPDGIKYHYLIINASSHGWNGIQASTNITVNSDERLKKDFVDAEKVSDLIMHIKPIIYSWKDERTGQRHLGFKAQDVKEALTAVADDADDYALVSEGKDGYLNLSYSELIPLIVDKLQKQQETIDTLEKRLEALERTIK